MVVIPYRITAKFGNDPVGDNGVDEVRYLCPKCIERKGTPDKSGHLYVNTDTYWFCCHRCGYKGKISYEEIKAIPKERQYKETISKDALSSDGKFLQEIEESVKAFESGSSEKGEALLKIPLEKVTASRNATEYLLQRGFTLDQMSYYDMRLGNSQQEFGRIVIPNKVKSLIYTDTYSARTFIGQVPKYHNPSNVKKSEIVFNLHRIKEGSPIIIVEGALTAVAAGYHAVATLGKSLSRTQASLISSKHPSVVYVNYDYGAEDSSHKACLLLKEFMPDTPIYEVLMKDDRDAADLSHEEYSAALRGAKLFDPVIGDIESLANFLNKNEQSC